MIRMKRKLLFAAAFFFVAWAVTSCESLSDCKFCRTVATDSYDGSVVEGGETEYCGAALLAIQGKSFKVGTVTTTYKCR